MNAMGRSIILAVVLTLALPAVAQETLSYQGNLFDANRQPVSASFPMVFSLYADRDGGNALWSESYDSVEVLDGAFTVELGSLTPFGADLAVSPSLYLGVSVNGAPEMSPRMKVSTAMRARWAAHAEDVRGEDIHPATVSIGDTEVINADGQWVGDPSGLRGADGATGERGPQGEIGPRGDTGLRGPEGPEGPRGAQGLRGPEGLQGLEGPRGPAGSSFNVSQDSDFDGFEDWLELMVGTEPTDESSVPADANQDGIPDILRGAQGAQGAAGIAGTDGNQGPAGIDGATIDTVEIDENGQLKIFMTDGRLLTAVGTARGADGAPGTDGVAGPIGPAGVSVTGGSIDETGNLVLTLSDQSSIDVGQTKGAQGAAGVGVNTAEIDANGQLVLTLTDGNTVNAGQARGADGQDAQNESPLTRLFDETARTTSEPAAIPRALNSGVDVPLDIDYNGVITKISVVVDITHPDISKLKLTLIAPNTSTYVLFDGANGGQGADLSTIFPEQTAVVEALNPLIGEPATGRWLLRVVDNDGANPNAVRLVNIFGLNIERRADDTWRLPSNLVVDGAVDAQTLCKIEPLVVNGQAVTGAITLTCGNQAPIRLSTFQCGNTQIDPGETCDDGNFALGDGCDDRCLLECGNGVIGANEQCDDGNRVDTDGCTSSCQNATCGDGLVWFGNEECDQGQANSEAPDAVCRTDCTLQRCGDSVVDAGEECDRGAENGQLFCSDTCRNSSMLSDEQVEQIRAWGASNFSETWTTCYDSSEHGLSAAVFHQRCDNKGPSVTVARLDNGLIVGGYTDQSWASRNNYRSVGTAFLFNLTNGNRYGHGGQQGSTHQIYDHGNDGPTFGGGHDWQSFSGNNPNSGYCNLGHDYACRAGTYGSDQCRNDFCGSYSAWSIETIEVIVAQ